MPATKTATTPTAGQRIRYWFDNVMSKGLIALMALLGLATLVFILVVALVVVVFSMFPTGEDLSFWEVLWGNLMRTLDPGTMGGDEGWAFRAAMLVVTIGGLIVVASLIGIISGAFDAKVDELRKGRSKVLETDHTLILGWSPKVFPIVSELIIANESRRKPAIVIVADHDKVEMEDAIRAQIPKWGNTRIICRSGSPMNLADLDLGNPHAARSVIVLAPEGSDDPDSVVIKTALALTNNPRRPDRDFHIVGEIHDADNLEAARLVGRHEAHWVLARELISRITIQSCRQSGLSVVYTELLDFDGDEIYFTEQPDLVGRSYGDAQFAFATSTVIGLVSGAEVLINPHADTIVAAGDRIIVIASDDDAIRLDGGGSPDESAIAPITIEPARPESTLILGCNGGLATMLRELDEYVAPGSTVRLVADIEPEPLPPTENVEISIERGDTTNRATLESLRLGEYDHIVVLAYEDVLETQQADARTLITLLHLREIADRDGIDLNVVSEMLDDANRELAEVTRADDFIVSEKLSSLLLSQVSENRLLADVFDVLFSSAGSEVYLRPASLYLREGATVDFYTVIEAARRRGETAIGYRIARHAHDSEHAYGVVVNPRKSDPVSLSTDDRVIVLAED